MTRRNDISLEIQFLERSETFFKQGARILLAVSGGVDSMTMAKLFMAVQKQLGAHIGIAHVNHGLRGKFSDRDAVFVKNFSERCKWPYYGTRIDVRGESKKHHRSTEEAARYLRYRFLDAIARTEKFDYICTAHHQSDQAETVLMRLVKGTGWQGLSGIRERRGKYVRPLLNLSKEEILRFARLHKLKFVRDASNTDPRFLRNRIRRQVLPLIKRQLDPQAEKHLARLSVIAADTWKFLRIEAERLFESVCRDENAKIVLEIQPFNRYLLIQRHALIELIFEKLKFDDKPRLHFDDFARIVDFIARTQSGKKLYFEPIECIRRSDQTVFQIRGPNAPVFRHTIERDRVYHWPEMHMRFSSATVDRRTLKLGRSKFTEYINADKISGRLVLRNWTKGDKFFPLGMIRPKKLSDFFIDEKVPLDEKLILPILCDRNGERIIWVCGRRLDDRFKITPATRHVLKMECHWNERD